MNEHIPDIEIYIKRLNWYLQEHYPANKKTTAEEWNALFLALINQGNAQEDTLAKICNEYLPLQIEKINTLVDTTNEHEASIAQLRTDTNKALKDSNYAVITADTALNQVVEKMGTVAYINNVLAPSLHYTRDPQAQLDDTAQGIINLQSQIDLMEQNTNVADVVGTFVDLVNYDKSKITANDIVEVLQDETRANADTYYRLVENAWIYIGKLGSYYTRGESDALLAEKVNYADYKDTLSFAESERQKSKNLLDINKAELKTGSEAFSTLLGGTITINAGNEFCYISSLTNLCNLKPNIPYTLSYVTNNGRSYIYQYIEGGTGFVWNNGETKTFTQTELDSIANSLLLLYGSTGSTVTYSNIQIEEGTVATDYQPYYGQITHNEDATVVFAESERQKSKNLISYPYINSSSTANGITFTVNADQSITANGTISDSNTNAVMYLNYGLLIEAGTYTISATKSIEDDNFTVSLFDGTNYYDSNSTFTLTKPKTINVYVQIRKTSTSTYTNANIKVMLCKGTDTDWQPYNGEIIHKKEFYETLQNTPAITFAESEYNKSKNLFDENKYLSRYCTYASNRWTTNSTRIGYNQSILTNETGATDNRNTSKLPLLKKGTYTLTIFNAVNNTNDTSMNIALYNQDGTINGTFTTATITTNTTITFTMASDLYLDIRVNGNVGTISFDHIQIEKGSTATTYQSYYGQITHNEDTPVVFAESEYNKSKNLFPFGNVSGTKQVQRFISLPAGTYTLSTVATSSDTDANTCVVGFYNNKTEWIGGGQLTRGSRHSITVSFAQPTVSLIFFASNNQPNSEGDTFTFADIQIEKGSIATAYYPYSGEITHNGDATVVFADAERQKSKNLFDAPNITRPTRVTYNSSTNTFTYTCDEVAEGATAFAQLNNVVMPAGNYVYSFNSTSTITEDTTYIVAKLTSTGGFESGIKTIIAPAGKVSIPFTLTEDTYIGLCWYYKTGWSAGSAPAGSKTISNVQLEQGSTATDYQPYYGEIVHQGDIAPVVLYDKNSTDPSINKGYTSGIMTDGVGNVRVSIDFSPYKKVKIYANLDRMNAVSEYDFTSGTDQFSILCGDIASARAKVNYMSGYISKTEFRPVFAGLAETAKDNNANYYVYRIEGIK